MNIYRRQSVSDEHSLILSDVRESDSGSYICTAYNLAGSDARAVRLVVQGRLTRLVPV